MKVLINIFFLIAGTTEESDPHSALISQQISLNNSLHTQSVGLKDSYKLVQTSIGFTQNIL